MLAINFKTTAQAETKDFGRFELSPIEPGYGQTLGNALRRVLLSSLPGAAITSATIEGATHQFTTLAGVKEDVVELLLNLKQVRLKYSGEEPVTAKLQSSGAGKLKASDIEAPAKVTVVNKDLLLANLADKKTKLSVKLEIQSGYGYLPAQNRTPKHLGEIILDAAFSPVVRVNFHVETVRLGRRADLDKLVLEIFTNGVIKPSEALNQAAEILIRSFDQIINPVAAPEPKAEPILLDDNDLLKLSVEELDLPTRIANALRKGGYATVADLAGATHPDFAKVKNLGGKSVEIIIKKLKSKGVEIK
ncbi:DNA-directed RNA polymerase subunit alpha [Patescibacteria group bacterium]|nr:DNA-directed RNA polymerase subunit alpha [Patescibacteria group bacterium]